MREAVSALGAHGMTVTELKGFGRQKGHTEQHRGAEYVVDFLPQVQVEEAAADSAFDDVVAGIGAAASSGAIGNGKIFESELTAVERFCTEETVADAVWQSLLWRRQ